MNTSHWFRIGIASLALVGCKASSGSAALKSETTAASLIGAEVVADRFQIELPSLELAGGAGPMMVGGCVKGADAYERWLPALREFLAGATPRFTGQTSNGAYTRTITEFVTTGGASGLRGALVFDRDQEARLHRLYFYMDTAKLASTALGRSLVAVPNASRYCDEPPQALTIAASLADPRLQSVEKFYQDLTGSHYAPMADRIGDGARIEFPGEMPIGGCFRGKDRVLDHFIGVQELLKGTLQFSAGRKWSSVLEGSRTYAKNAAYRVVYQFETQGKIPVDATTELPYLNHGMVLIDFDAQGRIVLIHDYLGTQELALPGRSNRLPELGKLIETARGDLGKSPPHAEDKTFWPQGNAAPECDQ